ncbi:MAG: hypothetical protein MK102_12130 [Fuerstiella sp.]|nr:hypothetical protein [Fuerstiella sp.]
MAIFLGTYSFALGLLFSLVTLLMLPFTGGGPALMGSFIYVAIMPFIHGIVGFLGGVVSAVAYNIIARMTGGIEMEFTPTE